MPEVFRVEEIHYDYNATLGVFATQQEAEDLIKRLSPSAIKDPVHSSWHNRGNTRCFVVERHAIGKESEGERV
jgi:hypothetical protein